MKLPRFWLVVRSVTPRSKSSNAKTVKQLLVISAIDSVSTWTPASRTSVLPWETLNYAASSGVGFLSTKTKVTDTAGSYHEFTWSRCREVLLLSPLFLSHVGGPGCLEMNHSAAEKATPNASVASRATMTNSNKVLLLRLQKRKNNGECLLDKLICLHPHYSFFGEAMVIKWCISRCTVELTRWLIELVAVLGHFFYRRPTNAFLLCLHSRMCNVL